MCQHYDDCAECITDDSRAMGWSSAFTQLLRFQVMSAMIDFSQCSVLDIGCGDGGLFHYLKSANIDVDYAGIDISHHMVSRAQARYPGISIRQANYFDYGVSNYADIVVVSGAFSLFPSVPDPMALLFDSIAHCYSLAQSHLIINLLTDHVTQKSSMFHSYDPLRVMEYAFTLTPYVTLNHSYLPNDFTLLLSRA